MPLNFKTSNTYWQLAGVINWQNDGKTWLTYVDLYNDMSYWIPLGFIDQLFKITFFTSHKHAFSETTNSFQNCFQIDTIEKHFFAKVYNPVKLAMITLISPLGRFRMKRFPSKTVFFFLLILASLAGWKDPKLWQEFYDSPHRNFFLKAFWLRIALVYLVIANERTGIKVHCFSEQQRSRKKRSHWTDTKKMISKN